MSGDDLRLVPPPTPGDAPIGWRCSWVRISAHAESDLSKPRPERRDFATREEAIAWQATLPPASFVTTVTPIYPRVTVSAKSAAASLDAAGWSLQHRQPK
jgi:hypothetical protein